MTVTSAPARAAADHGRDGNKTAASSARPPCREGYRGTQTSRGARTVFAFVRSRWCRQFGHRQIVRVPVRSSLIVALSSLGWLTPEPREDLSEDRRRRPRQDRPAAGRAVRQQGHEVVGADVNSAWSTWSTPAWSRSRARRTSTRSSPGRVPPGLLTATTDTADAVAERTPSSSSCRCSSTTRACPTSAGWTPRPRDIARGLKPGTLVFYETTLPVGHHPRPLGADARGGLRPGRGQRLPPRLLARSGC